MYAIINGIGTHNFATKPIAEQPFSYTEQNKVSH